MHDVTINGAAGTLLRHEHEPIEVTDGYERQLRPGPQFVVVRMAAATTLDYADFVEIAGKGGAIAGARVFQRWDDGRTLRIQLPKSPAQVERERQERAERLAAEVAYEEGLASRMVAAGHVPARLADGRLDLHAHDVDDAESGGGHNGPGCTRCGWSFCHHCGAQAVPACTGTNDDAPAS